jgi:large subunit ribosomal protein L21
MYALVDIKGKQYKVEKGSLIKIDRLSNETGDKVEFDSVLLISDKDNVKVGKPFLKGVKIEATVEDHTLDKKLIVYKYKKRKGYRKKQGHRQKYTLIKVQDITGLKSEKKKDTEKPATTKQAKARPTKAKSAKARPTKAKSAKAKSSKKTQRG